ncbi:MAG: hypothetical protein WC635_02865 [Bacteriovorax sp.]|jgi:hypothetical protein
MKPLLLVLMVFFSLNAFSKHNEPLLSVIPVSKLVSSLELKLKKSPKDASLLFELARSYSYASVFDDVQVYPKKLTEVYIENPSIIIYWLDANARTDSKAVDNLKKSILYYTEAIKLNPKETRFYVGRGWANRELNNLSKAKRDFVFVIDQLKPKTNRPKGVSKWDPENSNVESYSALYEASKYLRPLLNEGKDSELLEKASVIIKAFRPPVVND